MIFTTCAALPALLAGATAGQSFIVAPGNCPPMTIATRAGPTIHARGVTFRGLIVTGSATFREGRYEASGGKHQDARVNAAAAYGVHIKPGAAGVTFERATFTNAKNAVVIDGASNVAIRYSEFTDNGADGVLASRTAGLEVIHNRFGAFDPLPTRCTAPDGKVMTGLSSRACVATAGRWVDGFHPDAVQLRNGVTDFLIGWNETDRAIATMATTGDKPEQRGLIIGNRVAISGGHSITFMDCFDCVVRDNRISTTVPSVKTVLRFGPGVRACGNSTTSIRSPGTEACNP